MSFGQAVSSVFSQYAVFNGRARRSEYWWFSLATALVWAIAIGATAFFLSQGASEAIAAVIFPSLILVLFLPSLAVLVRRLHDSNKAGWWVLLGFIPFGSFVLLVFTLLPSDSGSNEYGPSPKG